MNFNPGDLPHCPKCDRKFQPGTERCMWCGADLRNIAPPVMNLECPDCGVNLTEHRDKGWVINICEKCGGLWISTPYLTRFEKMYEKMAATNEEAENTSTGKKHEDKKKRVMAGVQDGAESQMLLRKCPQCSARMSRRRYKKVSDVIVDECIGHGVWFDADEFERVVQFLENGGLREYHEYEKNMKWAKYRPKKNLYAMRSILGWHSNLW